MIKLDDFFDSVFVISLRGSDLRRGSITTQFRDKGLGSYEWIDAIDGAVLDLEALRSSGKLEYCHDQARTLLPGEVGCYLSHLRVYELMKKRGFGKILVLEDDAVFTDDALFIFSAVMEELPDDWDIVHFHSHIGHNGDTVRQKNRRRVSAHVRHGWNESQGTLCYAITARCAEYFYHHGLPIKNPIDGVTNWPTSDWCRAYHGYIADPFPCFAGNFASDICDGEQRQTPRSRIL